LRIAAENSKKTLSCRQRIALLQLRWGDLAIIGSANLKKESETIQVGFSLVAHLVTPDKRKKILAGAIMKNGMRRMLYAALFFAPRLSSLFMQFCSAAAQQDNNFWRRRQ
jgi:hypothetical protein